MFNTAKQQIRLNQPELVGHISKLDFCNPKSYAAHSVWALEQKGWLNKYCPSPWPFSTTISLTERAECKRWEKILQVATDRRGYASTIDPTCLKWRARDEGGWKKNIFAPKTNMSVNHGPRNASVVPGRWNKICLRKTTVYKLFVRGKARTISGIYRVVPAQVPWQINIIISCPFNVIRTYAYQGKETTTSWLFTAVGSHQRIVGPTKVGHCLPNADPHSSFFTGDNAVSYI